MLSFTPPDAHAHATVISFGTIQNIPRHPWAAKFNDRSKHDLFDYSQGYSSIEEVQNLGCVLLLFSTSCYGKVLSDRAMI